MQEGYPARVVIYGAEVSAFLDSGTIWTIFYMLYYENCPEISILDWHIETTGGHTHIVDKF